MTTPATFPVLSSTMDIRRERITALHKAGVCLLPIAIPWAMIAPHEAQAKRNHGGQSLARLAERGGLSPCEAVAVLKDREWREMPPGAAENALARAIVHWDDNRAGRRLDAAQAPAEATP